MNQKQVEQLSEKVEQLEEYRENIWINDNL